MAPPGLSYGEAKAGQEPIVQIAAFLPLRSLTVGNGRSYCRGQWVVKLVVAEDCGYCSAVCGLVCRAVRPVKTGFTLNTFPVANQGCFTVHLDPLCFFKSCAVAVLFLIGREVIRVCEVMDPSSEAYGILATVRVLR